MICHYSLRFVVCTVLCRSKIIGECILYYTHAVYNRHNNNNNAFDSTLTLSANNMGGRTKIC